jgi:hypothetical protein
MAAPVTVELEDYRMQEVISRLAEITGKDFRQVTLSESKAILDAAVRAAPSATRASIENNVSTRWSPQVRAEYIKRRMQARGLLKKSFVQLGERVRLSVKAPKYVLNARTRGGDRPEDTAAFEVTKRNMYSVKFTSFRVYDRRVFGILRKVIAQRGRYFFANQRKGFLDDMKKLANRYPGLELT